MDQQRDDRGHKKKWLYVIGKIILAVLVLGGLYLVGMIASVVTLLYGVPLYWLFLIVVGLTVVFIFYLLFSFKCGKRTVLKKGALVTVILFVIAAIGFTAYHTYIDRIPTVSQDERLWDYAPFMEDTKVARLTEPSALQLAEHLPVLDGATALYPLYAAFVQAAYPQGEYNPYNGEGSVSCSTTPEAYRRLIDGEVDMIFVAQPSDEQRKAAEENGVTLHFTPIGKEAFVFFVNAKNPVDELSVEQIQQIYSGEIQNWRELGGKKEKIRPFQRPDDSGSQTALQKLMADKNLLEPEQENIVDAMDGIITRTADYKNFRNAIGYSFRFYAQDMVKNKEIKLIKLNGIAANKETIRDGVYPITEEIYAVTTDQTKDKENVTMFLQWILSPQGQFLIEETGYVAIAPYE